MEAEFGAAASSVPIWLSQIVCAGNEEFLSDCDSDGWGDHNCRHSEDAGVMCSGKGYCILVCVFFELSSLQMQTAFCARHMKNFTAQDGHQYA